MLNSVTAGPVNVPVGMHGGRDHMGEVIVAGKILLKIFTQHRYFIRIPYTTIPLVQ